ncbi:MAG: T9SS type A sorting domain-containing protein, partial [Chitinophagales bacterium]
FTRTYGDSSKWQAFYGSSQTQDSGYVMIGLQSDTVNYDNNYFVIKSDKNGTMLWQQTYGGIEDNNGTRIYELENHNLILAGVKYFGNNLYYPWLVITDSAGNLIFEKQFYGSYDCGGTRITPPTLDDHIIMWGCLDTVIHPGYYPYPNFIAKLDSNLNVLWRTIYSIPNELDIWFVRQLADSSFILVGEAVDSTFTEKGWIAKVDKNGNKQWEHLYQYGSSFFNEFRDAQQTSDGGYIVCGGTLNAQNNQDIWLVKLDSNGCLVQGCVINTGTVEIVDQMQLQLFPNPASDYCTITFDIPPRENKVTLTVFDLQGRELVKEKLSSSDHQLELPLQNFATGLYVIELRTDNYFINKKLLKQ